MFWFNVRSLFTGYGWRFISHICMRRPVKTARALLDARKININDGYVAVSVDDLKEVMESQKRIVGIGFCMKPRTPPCPSGIANHDCCYLEGLSRNKNFPVPSACRDCYIRKTGLAALKSSTVFYIMTSARDILFDVYKPALKKRFDAGYFILCRYSFKPFFVGMKASGIKGCLFPFDKGDCRDYKTWSLADNGEKTDRTELLCDTRSHIEELLGAGEKEALHIPQFKKRGNVFFPLDGEK